MQARATAMRTPVTRHCASAIPLRLQYDPAAASVTRLLPTRAGRRLRQREYSPVAVAWMWPHSASTNTASPAPVEPHHQLESTRYRRERDPPPASRSHRRQRECALPTRAGSASARAQPVATIGTRTTRRCQPGCAAGATATCR